MAGLLHVSAALVLPLIAAGCRGAGPAPHALGAVALVPLVIGLPGNFDRLSETAVVSRTNRQLAYAIAHSPFIDDVPGNLRPMQDNGFQPPATAAWLARQAAAGRIPEPDEPVPPQLQLTATSRLVLTQAVAASDQPSCPTLTAPLPVSLRAGDEIPFFGASRYGDRWRARIVPPPVPGPRPLGDPGPGGPGGRRRAAHPRSTGIGVPPDELTTLLRSPAASANTTSPPRADGCRPPGRAVSASSPWATLDPFDGASWRKGALPVRALRAERVGG